MNKLDTLLKRVEVFEKLAVYGDRTAFLQSLSQNSEWTSTVKSQPSLSGPMPAIPGSPGTPGGRKLTPGEQFSGMINTPAPTEAPTVKMPEEQIKAYPPVPEATQDQLNKLLVPSGNIMPLKLDGKLGPATKKALEIFKAKYQLPATVKNIKETYFKQVHPELSTSSPF